MKFIKQRCPIEGAIVQLFHDQWCTSGAQTWCSSGRFQLICAIFSALSTIIAVQEQYASNEGLAMMHMDHTVPQLETESCNLVSSSATAQVLRPGARAGDFS